MSGLLSLSGDDFVIKNGTKGPIMCHKIPGFSLILFYSTQCGHCKTFLPIFKQLPGTIGGCQFGISNVSLEKQRVVKMSKETIAPITYVPYVILFYKGKPYMRYNGPQDAEELRRFVVEIAQTIVSKEADDTYQPARGEIKRFEKHIPAYCLGQPLYGCEDGVCYLPMEEAYTQTKNLRN